MPTPTQQYEIDTVVELGFPPDSVTLEGLFRYRNEAIDPVADARTDPGVFSPICGFTGALVLHGGSCQMAFGWYNATSGSTTPPPDDEIYELVPADISVAAQCDRETHCPLASAAGSTNPVTFNADAIRTDPRYRGGLVGFALKGAEGTYCPQTKFSQKELNMRSPADPPTNGAPWITAVIYASVVTPDAFYIAFEDLPLEEETWRGDAGNQENDGDFNDFVYFITGLTCEGGGELCDASASDPELKGVCAVGRTACAAAGTEPECKAVVKPQAERCDNLDNDCNGLVDDGELCASDEVCDRGTCVRSCSSGEFHCSAGLVCNARGFCVDPACKDVSCEAGQVCRGGVCSGGCDAEVTCPSGQECQLGRCVDPCMGVTCGANQVCERGVCVAGCSCRPCGSGKACALEGPEQGRCVDAGCEAVSCAPGAHCVGGACVDRCEGVVCPGGASCTNGECGEPLPEESPMMSAPDAGAPLVIAPPETAGAPSAPPRVESGGGSAGASETPASGGPYGVAREADLDAPNCGCKIPGASRSGSVFGLIAAGLALGLLRRRRPSR